MEKPYSVGDSVLVKGRHNFANLLSGELVIGICHNDGEITNYRVRLNKGTVVDIIDPFQATILENLGIDK